MKKGNIIFRIILGSTLLLVILIMFLIYMEVKNNNKRNLISEDGTFGVNFIKQSNKDIGKNNYMISPYSVEVALSMLREGTGNTTLEEMNKVVPERSIKSLAIKNKVSIANGLFIKNSRKEFIYDEYINKLKNEYDAEVIYDEFTSPTKINEWVNKKTNKMIPKILDSINPNFVLGIGNAIAFEEDWEYPFMCENTSKMKFTTNNKKIDVSMMHNTFEEGIYYFEDEDSKGVVLPYKRYSYDGVEIDDGGEQLEFIGILADDIDSYINDLTLEKISAIDKNKKSASDSFIVNVSLPRFEFDYKFETFKESLIDMGLEELFSFTPDFSNMIHDDDIYINEAIHQTYVKVDEKGTKAAAVTYFGTKDNAAIMETEYVNITFDKPFIFMIKDTESNEILFFGVVYEPELWTGNTCE